MTFEFDGEKYSNASNHQKEWGAKLVAELNLQGSEHILDLGCGDGAITYQLAELVPNGQVVGIDASQGMLKKAMATYPKANLSFVHLDIKNIHYVEKFDLIISNAALHWVKDHSKLLFDTFRALRDNGTIRFNFAADGNCSHFFMAVQEFMQAHKFKKYFNNFNWPWYMPAIQEYEALVSKSPFSEISVWGENADRYFPTVDELVKWIDQPSIVPFLECIAEEEKMNFRNAVVEKVIQNTLQENRTCYETFRRVNIRAKKYNTYQAPGRQEVKYTAYEKD